LASLNEHIKKGQPALRHVREAGGEFIYEVFPQMEASCPICLGLPKNKLEIISMDSFRAKNAVPADYTQGASDGSSPGILMSTNMLQKAGSS